jgi:hypothetical protein
MLFYDKLEAFIKKYYTNELIKGSLFFGLGFNFIFSYPFIEYFYGLNLVIELFYLFYLSEAFLFLRFILIPILSF